MAYLMCFKINDNYPTNTKEKLQKSISFIIEVFCDEQDYKNNHILIKKKILTGCRMLSSCIFAYNIKIKMNEYKFGKIITFRQTLTKWPELITIPVNEFEIFSKNDLKNKLKKEEADIKNIELKELSIKIIEEKRKLKCFLKIHPHLRKEHYFVFNKYKKPELVKKRHTIKVFRINWKKEYLNEIKLRHLKTKFNIFLKIIKILTIIKRLDLQEQQLIIQQQLGKEICPTHFDCYIVTTNTELVFQLEARKLINIYNWSSVYYSVGDNGERLYHPINGEVREYHKWLKNKELYDCNTRHRYRSKQLRHFKKVKIKEDDKEHNKNITSEITEIKTIIIDSFKNKLIQLNNWLSIKKIKLATRIINNHKLVKLIKNVTSYSLEYLRDNISLICINSSFGFISFRRNVIPLLIKML